MDPAVSVGHTGMEPGCLASASEPSRKKERAGTSDQRHAIRSRRGSASHQWGALASLTSRGLPSSPVANTCPHSCHEDWRKWSQCPPVPSPLPGTRKATSPSLSGVRRGQWQVAHSTCRLGPPMLSSSPLSALTVGRWIQSTQWRTLRKP